MGYLGEEIMGIGPSYASLIGESRTQPLWDNCLETHYPDASDIEILRKTSEQYMKTILSYEDKDLSRFQTIIDHRIVAWSIATPRPQTSDPGYIAKYGGMWNDDRKQPDHVEQRICVCTGRQIAIVPSAAKPGDVIIRFWNCSAAILMRPCVGNANTQDTNMAP